MVKKSTVKKILLINPSTKVYIDKSGSPAQRKHCDPPLGLAYLAATLRNADYEVEILDAVAKGYDNEWFDAPFLHYGMDNAATINYIKNINPDIIGLSVLFSNNINDVLKLCNDIKNSFPMLPIVLGGHHPTGAPHEVMENKNVDYVLLGEADLSILALMDHLNGKIIRDDVPGLYYRIDGKIKNTIKGIEPIVKGEGWNYYKRKEANSGLGLPLDLDSLPLPAWDLFDMDLYWNVDVRVGGGDAIRKRFGVMMASRGCRNACYFCTSPLVSGWRGLRVRSKSSLAREIEFWRDKLNVNLIQFFDDNFFANKSWAMDVLRMFTEKFPEIVFDITSGIEINQLDEEVIDLMAKANIYKCTISVESGDFDIQDKLIDKKVKVHRVPEIVRYLKKKGIEIRTQFMIGFPNETRSQIDRTVQLAKSLNTDDFFIGIVSPLPGTPLYDECKKNKLFLDGFNSNNIRYSMPSIRLPDITPEELENIRRNVWLESFEERRKKNVSNLKDRYMAFVDKHNYENCGFLSLDKVRSKMNLSSNAKPNAKTFM